MSWYKSPPAHKKLPPDKVFLPLETAKLFLSYICFTLGDTKFLQTAQITQFYVSAPSTFTILLPWLYYYCLILGQPPKTILDNNHKLTAMSSPGFPISLAATPAFWVRA